MTTLLPTTTAKEYAYHTDNGHGWICVPRQELIALGIERDISDWSYQFGNDIYLEHDSDIAIFEDAMLEKFNQRLKIITVESGNNCFVRKFERYNWATLVK